MKTLNKLLSRDCRNKNFVPASKCIDGILLEVANATDSIFDGLDRSEITSKLQKLTTIQSVALVEVLDFIRKKPLTKMSVPKRRNERSCIKKDNRYIQMLCKIRSIINKEFRINKY